MNNVRMIVLAHRIAREAHEGQVRKGSGEPYIMHPLRVASYVEKLDGVEPIHIAAALLHDVTEDCDAKFSMMIVDQLPREVWNLVCELTNPTRTHGGRATRKRWDRERLSRCSSWAQTIKLADRLDNVRSLEDLNEGFRKVYAAETVLLIDALEDSPRNNPIKREIMEKIERYLE